MNANTESIDALATGAALWALYVASHDDLLAEDAWMKWMKAHPLSVESARQLGRQLRDEVVRFISNNEAMPL